MNSIKAANRPSIGKIEEILIAPSIGVELQGIDLSIDLTQEAVRRIKRGLRDRLVVRLRYQKLTDHQLLAFSRLLGDLDSPGPNPYGTPFLPDTPEINVISNVIKDGKPVGNLGAGEAVWHADMTYVETPPQAAVLHSLEIPSEGGATYFANMYAAYEGLPPSLKRALQGKTAIHDASLNSAGMLRKGYREVCDPRETVGARHPLTWRNPETDRKCLFLGRRRNSYVVGMDLEESEALLNQLWSHATRLAYVMKHEWRTGDVLIWNNLCTLHRRDAFDTEARRILHRTQVRGVTAIN